MYYVERPSSLAYNTGCPRSLRHGTSNEQDTDSQYEARNAVLDIGISDTLDEEGPKVRVARLSKE